jgi:hypothetical protein
LTAGLSALDEAGVGQICEVLDQHRAGGFGEAQRRRLLPFLSVLLASRRDLETAGDFIHGIELAGGAVL